MDLYVDLNHILGFKWHCSLESYQGHLDSHAFSTFPPHYLKLKHCNTLHLIVLILKPWHWWLISKSTLGRKYLASCPQIWGKRTENLLFHLLQRDSKIGRFVWEVLLLSSHTAPERKLMIREKNALCFWEVCWLHQIDILYQS